MNYFDKDNNLICIHISDVYDQKDTSFFTPEYVTLQAGCLNFSSSESVTNHIHNKRSSYVEDTVEILFILNGKLEITLFEIDKTKLERFSAKTGDLIILISGGHGIKFIEDTKILEVKQGPFLGLNDKQRF